MPAQAAAHHRLIHAPDARQPVAGIVPTSVLGEWGPTSDVPDALNNAQVGGVRGRVPQPLGGAEGDPGLLRRSPEH